MRSLIIKRITAGLTAAMLMLTNVLLPVQPVFATDGEISMPAGDAVVAAESEQSEEAEQVSLDVAKLDFDYDHKATLCHATNSATNPYISITVDYNSFTKNGHDIHDGPVAYTVADAQRLKSQKIDWGDIIPAVPEWGYDGKNIPEGQTILDNDCNVTEGEPETVSIPVKLDAEDPCGLDNAYLITTALDSIDNISYEVNDDGSVTVTADEGYVLTVNGKTTYKTYVYDPAIDENVLCKTESEEPKFVDPCGTTNDYYQVEKTEYVEYYNGEELLKAGKKYYVTDASEVTITAKVTNEDYEIVNDTVYTHQFTNEPCVELDAEAWCDDLDTKIKVVLTNTTKKQQKLEVVITSGDEEVYSEVVRLKKNETETLYTEHDGDGEFTVSVYAMKGKKRGEMLTQKTLETVCVDTFTPEIYKKNQDGAILSTGTFDVEVCQMYSEFDRMVLEEENDGCTTYKDVMFGTDGSWFANNVDYERNVPTTVTITETKAPVGCKMSTNPWVFTWDYDEVQLMSYYHMSGSWDTEDGTNVFNLYNDCDKPGQGEYTPDPVKPVVPVEVETLADTGESENAILAVAAGMLLASVGLALSPRLYRGEA